MSIVFVLKHGTTNHMNVDQEISMSQIGRANMKIIQDWLILNALNQLPELYHINLYSMHEISYTGTSVAF